MPRSAPSTGTTRTAPPAAQRLTRLRRALLAHWDAGRRDLPWRRTRDAWSILVSEVMLQQTTVAAVAPHYERFLTRWPRAEDLAAAPDDELLAAWSGLGYYSRARNLRAAARAVAAAGGELPRDAGSLRALPGVGPYTAAAVASIAYAEPVAAIDGNVERVLARLFALAGDLSRAAGRAALRHHADALLERRRPGDWNQALMELGATVCRPARPRCPECPLRRDCAAAASDDPARYPQRPQRRAVQEVALACALIRRGNRLLLARRPNNPNAGQLELPACESGRAGDTPAAALADALQREHGLVVRVGEPLAALRHVIMHTRFVVQPWRATLVRGRPAPPLVWTSLPEGATGASHAAELPLTTVTRRVLAQRAAGRG